MNLSQLLAPQAILLRNDAQDSSDVICRLGGLLHQQGCVTDGFIDATLKREASMPTGLPLGGEYNAAIPHVDLEYVRRPAIALATLARPVIFRHIVMPEEEVPVQLVIMLALDQPKSQIDALQQVADLLQNPDAVAGLMAALTPEEVLTLLAGLENVTQRLAPDGSLTDSSQQPT
ncbi:MAG TPA: PTS sugar transporter subunit IIA [Anaerolineaceae bacterium]|nr:PTS sugar transporter subunit IIA [Anaerolineaceae bacterium]